MYELKLAANISGRRIFIKRREDKTFLPVAEKILDRDAYTCQFCSFQAREYQEIINLDGNYNNNKFTNLVTACCFCAQCLFLESVGTEETGGGQLIYLPALSQAKLNSFCHVLFCAMANGTGYQETAQNIYRSLKFLSPPIENKLGPGTSNPVVLGQLLIDFKNMHEEFAQDILKDIRLLPSYTKFSVQLDAWAKAALEELKDTA